MGISEENASFSWGRKEFFLASEFLKTMKKIAKTAEACISQTGGTGNVEFHSQYYKTFKPKPKQIKKLTIGVGSSVKSTENRNWRENLKPNQEVIQ